MFILVLSIFLTFRQICNMNKIIFLGCILFCCNWAFAQSEILLSGPMVGYSDYREVLIWVQTQKEADVKIGYYSEGSTEKFTKNVRAIEANDHIVKLFPHEVEYGTKYTYQLYINDQLVERPYPLTFQTQELWQWRKDPPDFSFAIGSCVYVNEKKDDRPSKPYGGGYEIFESIRAKNPDFMLWLGDNIYLREPDFLTERGIRHRNRSVRSLPEMQALLGSTHNYATWDDHDYGPNDSDRSYVNKKLTEKAFNDYWGNLNTNATGEGGITSHFLWNDVEVFLMDDRYFRDSNRSLDKDKKYLGDAQVDWLIQALTTSRAPFKIVCVGGQVVSSAAKYENMATYPGAQQRLFDRIAEERIEGVVFMSGDRHHTEISRMEREGAYPLIDITCSPLTSGTHKARDEGNTHQVKGKTFYDKNFGIVKVQGKRTDRVLTLSIYDTNGEKQWDYQIKASELRYARD